MDWVPACAGTTEFSQDFQDKTLVLARLYKHKWLRSRASIRIYTFLHVQHTSVR